MIKIIKYYLCKLPSYIYVNLIVLIVVNITSNAFAYHVNYYQVTEKFLKYDRSLLYAEFGENTAIEILKNRDEAIVELKHSNSPTIYELGELLRSENSQDRKVALANIYIRKLYDEGLFNYMVDYFSSFEYAHERILYFNCIGVIPVEQVGKFETRLFKLFMQDSNCEYFPITYKAINKTSDILKHEIYSHYINSCTSRNLFMVKTVILSMKKNKLSKLKKHLNENNLWQKMESVEPK